MFKDFNFKQAFDKSYSITVETMGCTDVIVNVDAQ